jgi:30S ribosomal protein S31
LASLKDFINFVDQSYNQLIIKIMGKGDKKTKRGKIVIKSYGVRRQRRKTGHNLPEKMAEEPLIAQKVKPSVKVKKDEGMPVEVTAVEKKPEIVEKPAKKKTTAKTKSPAKKEDKPE